MTDLDMLKNNLLFSHFADEALETLLQDSEQRRYEFGDILFRSGDKPGGLLFVVEGAVRTFKSLESGGETSLGISKRGESLAEIAAITDHVLEYSLRASGKLRLYIFSREAIAALLKKHPEQAELFHKGVAIRTMGGLVASLFGFNRGLAQSDPELLHSIGLKSVSAGDPIVQEGDASDRRLYVVRSGQVELYIDDELAQSDSQRRVAILNPGETFGENSSLNKSPQPAAARAMSDCVLLLIPHQTLRRLTDLNEDLQAVLSQRAERLIRNIGSRREQLQHEHQRRQRVFIKPKLGAGQKVIKRFSLVEQAEQMDCGASCLAMICKHYGLSVSRGKLREMVNTTLEGASLDSLAKTSETLGFNAQGVKCSFDVLTDFDLPFIAHWEGYHYIVVHGISKNRVWVADPALGFVEYTREEFERGWEGVCLQLSFNPDLAADAGEAKENPWWHFIRLLAPQKKTLLLVLIATLIVEILGLAPPIVIQQVLDTVLVYESSQLLFYLILALILTHLFTQVTTFLRAYFINFMIRKLDFTMVSQFYRHAFSLPLSYFATRRTGDIVARFQENEKIRAFLTDSTITTILNVLMLVIYLAVLLGYSLTLTLVLLATVVPLIALTLLATPKFKKFARDEFSTETDAESLLIETLSGAETVKAMGVERSLRMKWERKYLAALAVRYKSGQFEAWIEFLGGLFSAASSIIILAVGAQMVIKQQLSIGQLIAFNMLSGQVMSRLMELVGMWDEIHDAGVSMERLRDVLDIAPEQSPGELETRIQLPDMQGSIQVRDVSFRYPGSDGGPQVLKKVGFSINAGESLAIVGQSGSGKTTLVKLLVGFFPPDEGNILIDGYDLQQIDRGSLRKQVGYVMQSNLLFSGTVAENIALGSDDRNMDRIVEVAKLADAHRFIEGLSKGYEQVIGERGTGLSGGQIQRLCIARALYRDPRILIFDEATSALDTESESHIVNNMQEVMRGRTSIVIAHRLSTVRHADRILVMYEGGIAESGNHEELLAKRGMYYQLIKSQLE